MWETDIQPSHNSPFSFPFPASEDRKSWTRSYSPTPGNEEISMGRRRSFRIGALYKLSVATYVYHLDMQYWKLTES